MQDDQADEVPDWVLSFFAERPAADLTAWWEAVKRLYGPLGVRMDFRAATAQASTDDIDPSQGLADLAA